MDPMTNSQLIDLLGNISERIGHEPYQMADPAVVRYVKAIENELNSSRHEDVAARSDSGACDTPECGASLAECVENIKRTACIGRPLSEQLRHAAETGDKICFVSEFVFEDLWNGVGGWKDPKIFWDAVTYAWRNCRDFFESYDTDREIIENHTAWTQYYFDKQRNYLRNNFCLQRLCHLVMVYEALHGAEAVAEKVSAAETPRVGRPICTEPPMQAQPKRHPSGRWSAWVCVLMIVAVTACIFGTRRCDKGPVAEESQQGPSCVFAFQSDANASGSESNADSNNKIVDEMVCRKNKEQVASSNDVASCAIVLQATNPASIKDQVHRANKSGARK